MTEPPARGIPLSDLTCPTCSEPFEDGYLESADGPALICVRGHQWSVKTMRTKLGEADEVLLGRYLGDA